MERLPGSWDKTVEIGSHNYVCGYCGKDISSETGYYTSNTKVYSYICICHHCNRPSLIDYNNNVYPGAVYGSSVNYIATPEVEELYNEARRCISCNAFTASVLCSRKLIMNIAVAKGAKEGLSFVSYIEYLAEKGYIPPDGKEWVDHIRKKGNQANHEISIMNQGDAEELIDFLEMLLKFIFEFPALVAVKAKRT